MFMRVVALAVSAKSNLPPKIATLQHPHSLPSHARHAMRARVLCSIPGPFDHLPLPDASDSVSPPPGSRPPTEKQLAYAQRLASMNDVALPVEVEQDRDACSGFIDKQLEVVAPSEKQVTYAKSLAEEKGISVPDHVFNSMKATSDFIDQQIGGPGRGRADEKQANMPSEKQINYAVSLARQRKIGLPYDAIATKAGASEFIEKLVGEGGDRAPAGAAPAAPQSSPQQSYPPSPPATGRDVYFNDADIPF